MRRRYTISGLVRNGIGVLHHRYFEKRNAGPDGPVIFDQFIRFPPDNGARQRCARPIITAILPRDVFVITLVYRRETSFRIHRENSILEPVDFLADTRIAVERSQNSK